MLAIFENNYMKLNTGKFYLIVSHYKHGHVWSNIGKDLIWERNDENFLGLLLIEI